MPLTLASAQKSVLLLVDLQPSFLQAIHESERVLRRSEFLIKIAKLLGVPIFATEQYPERMGGTDETIARLLEGDPYGKMSFSCAGCDSLNDELGKLERKQIVLVGIETHICVSQTAHHLLQRGQDVMVAADAVSSRSSSSHSVGLTRIGAAGAVVAHSESLAYEWLQSAEHPSFRDALKIVKEYAVP